MKSPPPICPVLDTVRYCLHVKGYNIQVNPASDVNKATKKLPHNRCIGVEPPPLENVQKKAFVFILGSLILPPCFPNITYTYSLHISFPHISAISYTYLPNIPYISSQYSKNISPYLYVSPIFPTYLSKFLLIFFFSDTVFWSQAKTVPTI